MWAMMWHQKSVSGGYFHLRFKLIGYSIGYILFCAPKNLTNHLPYENFFNFKIIQSKFGIRVIFNLEKELP